jgi:hypothetical protein
MSPFKREKYPPGPLVKGLRLRIAQKSGPAVEPGKFRMP